MVKGVKIDPPIPSCVVHDCIEVAEAKPDLSGRVAQCTYSHKNPTSRQSPGPSPVKSDWTLAFFEYCGPGSREATEICKCGMAKVAHDKAGGSCPNAKKSPSRKFEPKGDQGFDRFYCGCFGWD